MIQPATHLLNTLLLNFDSEDDPEPIPAATLHPLFCFANLITMELNGAGTFDLDNGAVAEMAQMWTLLEILQLPSNAQSHITFQSLCTFALYCPQLEKLQMSFDASNLPASPAEILAPPPPPLPVAAFLANLFPDLGSIQTDRSRGYFHKHFDFDSDNNFDVFDADDAGEGRGQS
ncbi:hypothetical protein C8R43DRAFT_1131784 [Mycena crocata]|nr:hypothetical protein C8R43DRAFT_1131784 [Mycena crocata]